MIQTTHFKEGINAAGLPMGNLRPMLGIVLGNSHDLFAITY
jgi:hypothetical protein